MRKVENGLFLNSKLIQKPDKTHLCPDNPGNILYSYKSFHRLNEHSTEMCEKRFVKKTFYNLKSIVMFSLSNNWGYESRMQFFYE